MRQKPPRKIHVAGEDYLWVLSRTHDGYPGYVTVKVFSPLNRSGQRIEVRFRFDDPWVNYGPMLGTANGKFSQIWVVDPVTPGQVAQAIAVARKQGWHPTEKGQPLRFLFDAGEFKPET